MRSGRTTSLVFLSDYSNSGSQPTDLREDRQPLSRPAHWLTAPLSLRLYLQLRRSFFPPVQALPPPGNFPSLVHLRQGQSQQSDCRAPDPQAPATHQPRVVRPLEIPFHDPVIQADPCVFTPKTCGVEVMRAGYPRLCQPKLLAGGRGTRERGWGTERTGIRLLALPHLVT